MFFVTIPYFTVNKDENISKNCSLPEHKEFEAINYCPDCKIYMCNKCEKLHLELFKNHHQCNIDKNKNNIYTGLCKEKNHPYKVDYYCKDHNQLCCVACIAKIKGRGIGNHKDCNVCFINKIKKEKKNILNENINFLEEISKTLEQSINNLKKIFNKINENKDSLKMAIQRIFTKIRSAINDREDELLLDVDKQFDNLFFKEAAIKEFEKLPNRTRILIEKGKNASKEWGDKNKLNSIINDCIDIENNIKDINMLNQKIQKSISMSNIEVKFNPEKNEDLNIFLENIKKFGIVYNNNNNKKIF